MDSQRIRVARVSQAEPSSSASSIFVASEPTSCDRTSKATTGSKSFASCGKNLTTVLYPRTDARAWSTRDARWTSTMSASEPLWASRRITEVRGRIHPSRCGSRSVGYSWYRSTISWILWNTVFEIVEVPSAGSLPSSASLICSTSPLTSGASLTNVSSFSSSKPSSVGGSIFRLSGGRGRRVPLGSGFQTGGADEGSAWGPLGVLRSRRKSEI